MRFSLRTLLIIFAFAPAVLAGIWFGWPYALAIVGFVIFSAIPLGLLLWLLEA
jgi:hypothetical protein